MPLPSRPLRSRWPLHPHPLLPHPRRLPAAEVDIVASLTKLAALRDAGALSDAEFEAAKARLLA